MSTLTTPPFDVPEGLMRVAVSAYAVPPRAYHSFRHAQEVLEHWAEVAQGPGWRQPRETWLAALLHDAVYEPLRRDNEDRSASLARSALDTFLPRVGLDVDRIVHLISLTARHGTLTPAQVDADEAHFLDCDLAILGAPPATFDAYDGAIAEEHARVPAMLYRFNRRRFLRRVHKLPRIFLSDFFHARLDAAARANLARALAR